MTFRTNQAQLTSIKLHSKTLSPSSAKRNGRKRNKFQSGEKKSEINKTLNPLEILNFYWTQYALNTEKKLVGNSDFADELPKRDI